MEGIVRENLPLITTVIPTYQRPQLLRRSVLSVLNQTYPNLKVCIYDNASGDTTAEVVKELSQKDSRVNYYCHANNIGGFKNFIFGLSRISTSYFSVLSDDDILLPDFYEKALEGFAKHPEAIFSATQTIIVKDGKVLDIAFADYEEKLYRPPEGLLKVAVGGTNTYTGTLYKKEVLEAIDLDESLAEGPAEQDFLLRVATSFPYVISRSPGAIFVVHELAASSSRREVDAINEYMQMLNKIKNDQKISPSVRETVCQTITKDIVNSLWSGGWIDIKQKNFFRAKRIAQSLKHDFSESFKSFVLGYGVRLCEFPPLYYCFIGLNQVRKFMHVTRKDREYRLKTEYSSYLQYLEKYAAVE